ncbi:nuclear transport factor 2 family protein [Paractinoplanes lichenicola]|uniref:Nuclear transport factor 2 family protein n=1 Tax=Paractinoplanes lichenicola TaxID=2802976 RepID=A0ABS1W0L3_9ACTN|nr:nuclear transport factor 2 family protein [Actinoplanes lichenicola]MBL7260103.1 nuclear transport factor 2 family protein [Actinoplanes lichenicola]
MSQTSLLTLDRYLIATDRAVADKAALPELLDLFDPDAVVQLDGTPIRGAAAIRELYQGFITFHTAIKHYWNSRVLPDGRETMDWVCAARTIDGAVITVAGIEHATLGPDGRMVELHNTFTRRAG